MAAAARLWLKMSRGASSSRYKRPAAQHGGAWWGSTHWDANFFDQSAAWDADSWGGATWDASWRQDKWLNLRTMEVVPGEGSQPSGFLEGLPPRAKELVPGTDFPIAEPTDGQGLRAAQVDKRTGPWSPTAVLIHVRNRQRIESRVKEPMNWNHRMFPFTKKASQAARRQVLSAEAFATRWGVLRRDEN